MTGFYLSTEFTWFKLREELEYLGLGGRVVLAIIHEAMDTELFIEARYKGFGDERLH